MAEADPVRARGPAGPGGTAPPRARGSRPGAPYGRPIAITPYPAARIGVAAAVVRLDGSGLAFVFFAGSGTGRGSVVYRRFDGTYGLIEAV